MRVAGLGYAPLSNAVTTGPLYAESRKSCRTDWEEPHVIGIGRKNKRVWTENCDHLKRSIISHRKRLERFGEDMKAEQTPIPSLASTCRAIVEKHNHQMSSAIQEIASHLTNFCCTASLC